MPADYIRWNPIELINDLLAAGMTKEEAYEEVRKERRKRNEASTSQAVAHNDNSLRNHGGGV